MALYSDKVMDHFMNPRNIGDLESPDGIGEVGNPLCGDMMTFMIKVKDGRIEDVKFKTFGCGAAIAVSSMVSEMAIGKTLGEAMKITNDMVAAELGGLPKNKMHCSNLGADALRKAVENYLEGLKTGEKARPKAAAAKKGKLKHCPYCDAPLDSTLPFCLKCKGELIQCPGCGTTYSPNLDICPSCGEKKGSKETTK